MPRPLDIIYNAFKPLSRSCPKQTERNRSPVRKTEQAKGVEVLRRVLMLVVRLFAVAAVEGTGDGRPDAPADAGRLLPPFGDGFARSGCPRHPSEEDL